MSSLMRFRLDPRHEIEFLHMFSCSLVFSCAPDKVWSATPLMHIIPEQLEGIDQRNTSSVSQCGSFWLFYVHIYCYVPIYTACLGA